MADKRQQLTDQLNKLTQKDTCIAFSGGVDSSLLLKLISLAAKRNKTHVYAVTFDTVLHPKSDVQLAKKVAMETGAEHHILTIDELEQPEIRNNDKRRCYYCKKALFEKLITFSADHGINTIIEGTNYDDLSQYRPGIQAVHELNIHSPLAQAKLTKEEIRRWAREIGLSVAERPATPCMATRLPYGANVDLELLKKIELGEEFLRELGFANVRLRVHNEIARLEVNQEILYDAILKKDEIIKKLKDLGFRYITLDLEGFRSGSMDEYSTYNNVLLTPRPCQEKNLDTT